MLYRVILTAKLNIEITPVVIIKPVPIILILDNLIFSELTQNVYHR
jgi:hypothetical protein